MQAGTLRGSVSPKGPSLVHTASLLALASVLRASPESDALLILGRLLDSLPIGFHVTDCADDFRVLYANRVWEGWLGRDKLPVEGKSLAELFPSAEESGMLAIMREVCATAQPQHLKGFEFRELGMRRRSPGETSRWDWEIYPLAGSGGGIYLLNVIMDVSAAQAVRSGLTRVDRQTEIRRREEASGVLRIFGVAPDTRAAKGQKLSVREDEVAEFVAMGLTNDDIAARLSLSSATIASHVAHILSKLHFRSRTQVAAWFVGRRLARVKIH